MFLLPVGGVVDPRFGVLTSPAHRGVPLGITQGMVWGADNGVYSGAFDREDYLPWLESMIPYQDSCLFVLAPDVVGDAEATVTRYSRWAPKIRQRGFPVAFAAQDGQEHIPWPTSVDETDYLYDCDFDPDDHVAYTQALDQWELDCADFDALFIGGTTAWKVSRAARGLIRRAHALGKHIHIGRINWWRRYEYFRGLEGSDAWTCDGTRTRYEGTGKTMVAWAEYQARGYNLRLPLPDGDCDG